ncbi:MAG: hypothetical protein R3360_00340 [Alphaproteobacteria bacterium]|nr:hypothetical protein [Alphaproteobacteria bacterium]
MNRFMMVALAGPIIVGLAACSSPRDRVNNGLQAFGLPKASARCMSYELDERLPKRDMKVLGKFLKEASRKEDPRPGRLIGAVERIDNPEIISATAKASISCTVLR